MPGRPQQETEEHEERGDEENSGRFVWLKMYFAGDL